MDLRLQGNPQPHFRVNGGGFQSPRPGDDALQFLSQEEQECIQFFEKTIDSLEESLEENEQRRRQVKPTTSGSGSDEVHGPKTSSPSPSVIVSSLLARHPGPKDQDIIDLVRLEPDLVQSTERTFNPTSPDFQSMVPAPESHFEIKPKREHVDALPSEYDAPLPGGGSYHPPGCIPTPVLIAQKIAEHQTGGLESEKPPSSSGDPPVKQAPPTSAKPTRFPANISLVLASKEPQNPALTNVSIEERRKKMLANLTGSHPLLQEESPDGLDEKDRSVPKRSISFKDPTPDKSRMEALSKLGLTRGRASSGGTEAAPGGEISAKPPEERVPPPRPETSTRSTETRVTAPHQSQMNVEAPRRDSLKSQENRDPLPSPPPPQVIPQSSYTTKTETRTKPEVKAPGPHQSETRRDSLTGQEHRSPRPDPRPVLPPPEVSSLELNRYGGKSIIVKPGHYSKSDPAPPEPKTANPALAHPSEFNPYGGKSKVLGPTSVTTTRHNLPDILSSHIDKIQTPPARPDPVPVPVPTEFNSYGGKSRTINPSPGSSRPADAPVRSSKPPAPIPAPRPPRHSYHAGPAQKPAPRALSPDHKRRSASMFRPQGVTVQFSGRGATDDSRREALRKLGLLKNS
ncbi:uncharacterized protein V6R79_015620 [Siganus canaliculatus]